MFQVDDTKWGHSLKKELKNAFTQKKGKICVIWGMISTWKANNWPNFAKLHSTSMQCDFQFQYCFLQTLETLFDSWILFNSSVNYIENSLFSTFLLPIIKKKRNIFFSQLEDICERNNKNEQKNTQRDSIINKILKERTICLWTRRVRNKDETKFCK